MGFRRRQDEQDIDFGSQLSVGYKGMLINGDWVTWSCDKNGSPHHDAVAERYYNGEPPEVTAGLGFGKIDILSIFSQYPLFDERTQIPMRNIYGNPRALNLVIDSVDGETFEGSYTEYRRAEAAWEEQQEQEAEDMVAFPMRPAPMEKAIASWVWANCRFAQARPTKAPVRTAHPPMEGDEDAALARAESYFDIGHGEDANEVGSDPATHSTWVLVGGEIETVPGDCTHGANWGHDLCDRTYKGHYEGDTGRLSVVSPNKFRGAPEWLLDKLKDKFGYITEVHEF